MKAALRALAPLAALSALLVAGCAQDVGDIVRVQPEFVKKSDFDGTWYIRSTVAEVPPASTGMFTGWTADVEKICWEITPDYLIAYRAYEKFPGKDPDADQTDKEIGNTQPADHVDEYFNGGCYKDAPVAAYKITSHFDIQRQYNPATGEQTNVIVENSSDRPWYDRQFMHVNWASNAVESYAVDADTFMGNIDFVSYVVEAEGGDWAFKMETAEGEQIELDPEAPGVFEKLFDENRKPAAYIDVTKRVFMEPPSIQYGPYKYPFCWIYDTYDCTGSEVKIRTSILKVPDQRTYEPRFYGDERFGKFGFFRTERLSYDRQYGHTDEGRIYLANIHNIWQTAYDADGNLIPEKDRTPEPIVYALSPNYPAELVPEAQEVARGWAKAFTRAVAYAQNRSVESVFNDFPYEDANGNYLNEGLFRLDYNEDGHAKIGDLRHNFIYWVDGPHQSSPLGYGPSSTDPETGEVIAAQAFVYGASLEKYARMSLDQVKAINGDLELVDENLIDGEYVENWIEQNRDRVDPRARLALLDKEFLLEQPIENLRIENSRPDIDATFEAVRQFGMEEVNASLQQRLGRIKGTELEAGLVNGEIRGVLAALNKDPSFLTRPVDDEMLQAAHTLTIDVQDPIKANEDRIAWASRNNIWLADFTDGAVLGLAKFLADKQANDGWTEDQMYRYVLGRIYQAVTEHEVGHTVGLRHNFQGSYDALNFHDEYWDLRQENLQAAGALQSINDMFAMSEQTPAQIEGRMREYEYSSIMDYGARFNTDFHGLGKYDEAAILFGYADFVEVFNNPGQEFVDTYFSTYSDGTPKYEGATLAYGAMLERNHYSQLPFMMGGNDKAEGIQRMRNRDIVAYEQVKADREINRPDRHIEVPYMFCPDEWANFVNSCLRWDQGADLYEQTRTYTEGWLNYYWFNNYRRDRHGWSPYSVLQRSYSRTFANLSNFYVHWVFKQIYRQYDQTAAGGLADTYTTVAIGEGLNFLTEVITTPNYGSYVHNPDENVYEHVTYDLGVEGADFEIPRGPGRRYSSIYDYDSGPYYYQYPVEAGHFWDWIAAMLALSESQGSFRGQEVQSDFTSYILPYSLAFGEDLKTVIDGIDTESTRMYGPRVVQDQAGASHIVARPTWDYLGVVDDQFIQDLPVVEPYITWTQKFYNLLFGMSQYTSQYSLDFPDEHRIFRMGTAEELTPASGWEVVTFELDSRGIVYGALRDPNAERETAAVTLIRKANELKAEREAALARAEDMTLTTAEREQAADLAQDLYYEIENTAEWMDIERTFSRVYNTGL